MMKRLWKILKWTGIVAGALIGILLIIATVWVWRSGARLEERLEALRSAGEPLTLAELARDPIPPETNAAVLLRRAQDDVQAIAKELNEVYGSETYQSGDPTDSELKTIGSALEAYPKVVPLLEQAAACPDYDSQADYTAGRDAFMKVSLDRIQSPRSVARVLRARALLLKSQGKLDEALEGCILILRLTRHFQREPMLISYLVTVACQGIGVETANHVLRAGPVAKASRGALEAELAPLDRMEAFGWAMKSERVIGLEGYREIPGRNWWPIRAMWDNDQSAYLDLIDQHLALASRPYAEVAASDLAKPPEGRRNVLAQLVKPPLLAAREAADRTRASVRCLRVLNAVQTLEAQDATAEPKLADLGLPAEATTDPFNGKPLNLKKLPQGWLIYSVGKNLKDDGGSLDEHQDVGLGPPP